MIYNTTVRSINESELNTLLENTENRFEYETMAEASAIVIGEQEENWSRFMQGVGLSELSSVMEGEEVIYEGAKLESFLKKAKAFFEMAISKLAQITKAFIAKVMQFVAPTSQFLKMYKKELDKADTVKYNGYDFNDVLNDTPVYDLPSTKTITKDTNLSKDSFSAKAAEKQFKGVEVSDDPFRERVVAFLYNGKEKKEQPFKVSEQVKILEKTKDLKKAASKSYKDASDAIKKIIKELNNAKTDTLKSDVDNKTDTSTANHTQSQYTLLINYWKAFSNCTLTYHATFMTALSARNRQAKAICTKAITKSIKDKGREDRNNMREKAGWDRKTYSESYVNTDAFLGAVEFI